MRAEPARRIVIDTNVWISGFLTRTGVPAILSRWVVQNVQPVFSPDTFAELKERLWRPKFDRYLAMDDRKRLLHNIDAIACWVNVPSAISEKTYCRDRDDDKFIHAALAAQASLLVTGDNDLLCLHPLDDLRILTPRAALDELFPQASQ